MKLKNRLGLAVGAAAISVLVWSGLAGAAGLGGAAASHQRSVPGSYVLNFFVSGGGGGFNQPLTLASNGTAVYLTSCQGLWTMAGKEFALEINPNTCNGDSYLFAGTISSKGLATEKRPGTFIATFVTGQGPETETGTWYATRR